MEKVLGHIFADLHLLEHDMARVAKSFKAQNRVNKSVACALLVHGVVIYCAAVHCMNNKEKIESLTKEVEELKKSKGE